MEKFIERESAILFRVCTILAIAWVLCCTWNGVWGYRMDAADNKIAMIYANAEEDQWALTGGDHAIEDSVATGILPGDSTIVLSSPEAHIPIQNLLLDSIDILKIEGLNKISARSRNLMIAPHEIFMFMFYVLACTLIVFYPLRILAFCIRNLRALRENKNV